MIIAMDLDEVVFNIRDVTLQEINRLGHDSVIKHWSEWNTYSLIDMYGIPAKRLEEMYINKRILERGHAEDNASEVINRLYKDHTIVFVTARGWHPQAKAVTMASLDKYNIPYDGIEVVPLFGGKTEALRNIGDVDVFIDDNAGHVQDSIDDKTSKRSVVRTMPWNAQVDLNCARVDNLLEFETLIKEM